MARGRDFGYSLECWLGLNSMATKVDSRFATPEDAAFVLGVSARRVQELKKLIESTVRSRRSEGVSWVPPAVPRLEMVSKEAKSKGQATRSRTSRKSKTYRGTGKRGKPSKKSR